MPALEQPIGYSITRRAGASTLARGPAADLQMSARERPRGHRGHRHRGADGPGAATATARGWPDRLLRARRRPGAHRRSSGDRPEDMRGGARLHGRAGRWTWCSPAAGSGRPPTTSRPRSSGASRAARWSSTRRSRSASRRSCGRCRNAGRTSTWRRSRRATASRPRPARARRCSSRSARRRGSSCRRRGPRRARRSWCCRARRASFSRCGRTALDTEALRAAIAGRDGLPPADAAAVRDPRVGDRRDAARGRARGRGARSAGGHDLPETAARSRSSRATSPHAEEVYDAFEAVVRRRHADTLFSDDGSTVDEQVARRCCAARALAPPCTIAIGRVVHRRPAGGAPDRAGRRLGLRHGAGSSPTPTRSRSRRRACPRELIERHGAVSSEVAEALADGARARLGADVGVGRHRHRRPGRRQRGEARGPRLAERRGPRDASR